MIATDFTRDDCKLGSSKRLTYAKLEREYKCAACTSRLGMKWNDSYPEKWHIECLACASHDFVHEREREQRASREAEFVDGLPPILLEIAGLTKTDEKSAIFSLSPATVEI